MFSSPQSSLVSTHSIPTIRFGFPATQIPSNRISMKASSTVNRPATSKAAESNLYEVLRLKKSASPTQIKAAYRSLVKQFHPDTNGSGSSPERFLEIHNAYATLSDPMAKARYDLTLSIGLRYHHGGVVLTSCPDFVGYHQTRRWETDQCW